MIDDDLVTELQTQGVKFSYDELVKIARLPDGRIVFLEQGNSYSGLQHILSRHADQFATIGLAKSDIPHAVMVALAHGNFVSFSYNGAEVYDFTFQGKMVRVAVVIGSNGYIVTAFPY